jgi:TPP-dependent indolepyruvate ferredoxin oxidoreductase alpha subunit
VEVGVGPVATRSGEQFSLEDRYRREAGAVCVTGIQALVRMLLDRARADQRAGRATPTYVTGYEGSPLGGLDVELARQAALLAEHAIVAQPGLNEELAAENLEYGQHAVELSRASGLWAALKVATVVADGAATAAVTPWSPASA